MNTTVVKILLVEDSPSDADVLQEMLHQTGPGRFEFIWVERLDEALARLRQEAFDMVLLDLSLPDSTGPDTFLRARNTAPQVPIVVLTGGDNEDLGLEAVRHGVQDYLVKGRADGRQIARAIRYAVERQRMEEALRASEQRFHTLFSSMTEGFALHEIICDDKGEPCDYRFLDVNDAFERLTGLKREDVVGKTYNEVLPNDDPRWVKAYGAVALTGQPVRFENYSAALKRHYEVFAYRPAPRQFAVVFMDITERKRVEQAVRDREEELAAIYEDAPLVMMLVDGESRVHKANKQAEAFAGISITDLLGRRGGEALRCLHALEDQRGCCFGPHCEHCALRRTVVDTFETGRNHYKLEATLPFAIDGKPEDVTFLLSTSRLNVRGQALVLVTMQDITARKRAEEALQRAHDELELRVQERTAELEASNALLQRALRGWRALSECNEALVRATSEAELLERICRVIVEFGGYRMAWVGFAEQDAQKTVRPVAQAGFETGYLDRIKVTWADKPRGRGPTGTAIRTVKPNVSRNMLKDPRLVPWRPDAVKRGYASSAALPLLTEGRCLGALTVYAQDPDAFNGEELALLTELASDLTFGIMALRTRAERERLQEELLRISERERSRIGQDLHDGVCQRLMGISLMSAALRKRLATRSPAEAAQAAMISELTIAAATEARGLAHGLHPVRLDARGLMSALEELAGTVSQSRDVTCRFVCPRAVLIRDNTAAMHVFRIAQEAVNNAITHGRARLVTIGFRRDADTIKLTIKDNGRGFPKRMPKPKGMGLQIMQHRAAMIGASLHVRRAGARGTMVTCLLPAATVAQEQKELPS
jgi:PAS domain S-box-containing protein